MPIHSAAVEDALQRRLTAVEGARVDARSGAVRVATVASAVAVVAILAETRTRLRAVYGTSAAGQGPAGAVTVALGGLDSVEVDTGSHTVHAGAGAPMTAVRSAIEAAGLTLAGPLGTGSRGGERVGDVIRNGGLAPRVVTGMEAVLATGETVRFGGRMAKDVAPYAVPAAILGSGGRLAVLLAVTLRLVPGGASVAVHQESGVLPPGGHLEEAVRRAFDPDDLLLPSTD